MTVRFPFSAVVGHDDLRLALLLNAVRPTIGGVLVRGEKGTAKSTAVRALAALLPDVEEVAATEQFELTTEAGVRLPSEPPVAAGSRRARLVELPIGATEDRLIGSLDLERALSEGLRAFQPGLLVAAHRGVLYVDEVNLLPDHLVDLLLDAAAMGRVHAERDGISLSYASEFMLIGTMNPEEGELRPQLLDRFGLTVSVAAPRDVETRAEVIRRRMAFELDPNDFAARFADADAELAARIAAARLVVDSVSLPESELRRIAAVCAAFEVDGMRADLVVARTAVAHAAWRGASTVEESDVEVAVRLALPHRRRRDPFDEPGLEQQQLEDAMRQAAEHAHGPDDPDDDPGGGQRESAGQDSSTSDGGERSGDRTQPPATPSPAFRARLLQVPGVGAGAPGRRSKSRAETGRTIRAVSGAGTRLHLLGTVAAAAPHQRARGRRGSALVIRKEDLRLALREGREANLILFVVDASGSMAAHRRMSAVTGAVISLLRDAYQRRDKVAVITFAGAVAELVLPATSSVDAAAVRLRRLSTGGRTPLADGLLRARKLLRTERIRDPHRRSLLLLLTDGRATRGIGGDPVDDALRAASGLAADGIASIVVDCESGPVRLGLPARMAAELGGGCLRLEELSADSVAGIVRAVRAA